MQIDKKAMMLRGATPRTHTLSDMLHAYLLGREHPIMKRDLVDQLPSIPAKKRLARILLVASLLAASEARNGRDSKDQSGDVGRDGGCNLVTRFNFFMNRFCGKCQGFYPVQRVIEVHSSLPQR